MSLGERILLRSRWFVYDAGSRPVAVVAVLVILGAVAAMGAAFTGASLVSFGGFRAWIFVAVDGFRPDVQIGVLLASVLLVIDALNGGQFPGQRVLFGVILILAAAGVVANITAIVAWLTEVEFPPIGVGMTAEVWTVIIAGYLTPTVLAAVSGWVALTAVGTSGRRRI
jgi:hypothetical protein